MGTLVRSVVSMCPSGFRKGLWGERCVFKEERNKCKFGQDRSAGGREFQIEGAAKGKERRPLADRISGAVRSMLFK